MAVEIIPFLQWQPTLDPRQLYSQPPAPEYPERYKDQLYYLEHRSAEGGRGVLVSLLDDGRRETLTPEGFNIRSRVHEYGGKAFLLANDYIWFSNDTDHRIYRQKLVSQSKPEVLSAEDKRAMFIDFQLSKDNKYLVFVEERLREHSENENRLCAITLAEDGPSKNDTTADGEIYPLLSGADFYANPVISPDGTQLAWIEWDHPLMPWDGTLLKVASLQQRQGRLTIDPETIVTVAGGMNSAVCQLQYAPGGQLFFTLDGHDQDNDIQAECWDLFAWNGSSVVRLTNGQGEFGQAHWVFGQQRYAVLDEERIVAIRTSNGRDQLVEISISTSTVRAVDKETSSSLSQLIAAGQDSVIYTATSFSSATSVHEYSVRKNKVSELLAPPRLLDDADISTPQHLEYRTRDGGLSHAWYYPPRNQSCRAPEGMLPPLLVMVHGGPTSRCDSGLNYQRQYWTGRGFAVLDVNHRGSTGYCRDYRQSLQGQWGLMDSQDVADGVSYVVSQGMANPGQVCIRGGSAGGYVVLQALTSFPELFCAGACYYGIGNLVTLMECTHKFEAHYLDGLLGEPYHGAASDQPGSPYFDRSPLHELERLQSPMIIFQGLEDKVVPPQLSRELVENLDAKGIFHQYIEYPGEGHGFRKLETRIDALEKEATFFSDVINNNRN